MLVASDLCFVLLLLHATSSELIQSFSIRENQPANSFVGKVREANHSVQTVVTGPRYFFIFTTEADVKKFFAVDEASGEIWTKTELDHERYPRYVFLAIPIHGGEGIRVQIDVVDENDNAPLFPTPSVDVSLSEYAKIGSEIALPSATDRDSSPLAVQKYVIESGNERNAFRLSYQLNKGVTFLDLVVNSELDREANDHYELTIRAYDGGSPPLWGTLLVNVSILDVNDNAPEFEQPRYLVQLPSNITKGHEVTSVKAVDRDEGENGRISYHLAPSPEKADMLFSIDPQTGVILWESEDKFSKLYELLVTAKDNGQQPLMSSAFVLVTPTKTFQGATLKITYLTEDGKPSVKEDAIEGSFVARISVLSEEDPSTRLRCSVKLDNIDEVPFSIRTIDSVSYLQLSNKLDYETQQRYVLTVVISLCSDQISTLIKNVTIDVVDVNDNEPQFTKSVFEAEVKEKTPPGTSVLQVEAFDRDECSAGMIRYSLLETNSSQYSYWFKIDANSGLITSSEVIDCGISPKINLTVIADDGGEGQPGLTGVTNVIIHVVGVNENPPNFQQQFYRASLSENAEVGFCFLQVQAEDPDCGYNSDVIYSIPHSQAVSPPFYVENDTGRICVKELVDYETQKTYYFNVESSDPGGLKSRVVVRVDLEDSNDNAPVFSPISYNVSLRIKSAFNDPVVRVFARDQDSGKNGEISYEIAAGNEEDSFRIDSKTGELYVRSRLFPTIYQLKVQAKDSGGLVSSVLADVTVTVLMDEFPNPAFERRMYEFSVREDAKPGTLVGSVLAHGSSIITYSIAGSTSEDAFVIDRFTGNILVERSLDFEREQMVAFAVKASVENEPGCNFTQIVVNIEDVNDHSPTFDVSVDQVYVSEDQNVSVPFYTLGANDRDAGANGALIYAISVNPDNMFIIQPLSGELRVSRRLHYELANSYKLVVSVRDNGVPPRSAEMALKVVVVDTNDHAPDFAQPSYRLNVPENAAVTMQIFQFVASDKDIGMNGKISYGIQQPSNGTDNTSLAYFGIFSDTGWLYVRRALDREHVSEFVFTAFAKDNGKPPRTSTATVTLTVTDVNDNAPHCDGIQNFMVPENQVIGSLVGKAAASDPDSGLNGTVHYFMSESGPSAFTMNTDGEIFVGEQLDREVQDRYDFDLIVIDGGSPPLKERCRVHVAIEDVNDNSPVFVLPLHMKVFLREEQNKGAEVLQALAKDLDLDENGTVRYELRPRNDGQQLPFTIDSLTGVVTTTRVIDYESDPRLFEVEIIAKDMGIVPRRATKQIIIQVTDINDSEGVSGNETATTMVVLEVSENVAVGSAIGLADPARAAALTVEPSDEEALRQMSDVSYEIVAGNSLSLFDVDRFTGQLIVVKPLDYERSESHFLKIARTDASSRLPLVQLIHVKIYLKDENDNWPQFPDDIVVFSILENARVGSSVWTFNATDKDSGSFGRLEYDIVRQSPNGVFSIDRTTGELTLSSELDHETARMHLVVVRATDQATSATDRKSSMVTSKIYVIDVNDNPPRFNSNDSFVLYENSLGTEPVLYVVAKDEDWMDNARISYSMADASDSLFSIDSVTGALTLQRRLGSNEALKQQVTVVAADHGHPSFSSTHTLTIEFQKFSGLTPSFRYAVFTVNLTENCPFGTEVTTLELLTSSANDGSDYLNFTLFSDDEQPRFTIDSLTGLIKTVGPIDREEKSQYTLIAIVHGGNRSEFYDTTTVVVNVVDVNDNAPVLNQQLCDTVIQIRENRRISAIKRMVAFDPDDGEGGTIFYSIAEGNQDGDFRIDPSTGTLSCQPLDRERQEFYNLTILATDSGPVRHSDSCTLLIEVMDENDNDPVFERSSYVVQVMEDADPGTVVATVKATDKDEGLNGKIVYAVADHTHAGDFGVRPNTGDVVTLKSLNFENVSRYTVQIKATDMGLGRRRSQLTTVVIQLIDVNEHAPVFQEWHSFINVPSSILAGQRVAKVSATDADGPGPNSELRYSLLRNSPFFNIHPDTGVISASVGVTQIYGRVVHLLVIASDKGTPPRNGTSVVTVTSSDGDSWPKPRLVFEKSLLEISIKEHMKSQSIISTLHAHCSNEVQMPITYKLIATNASDSFIVGPQGAVILASSQNLLPGNNALIVEAVAKASTDSGQPAFAYAIVNVHVVDINDHKPQFLQEQYLTAVIEGQPRGQYVLQVTAIDLDAGENAQITYNIVGGNIDSAFAIDVNGVITTNVELDREITPVYTLTIAATDHGVPHKFTTTTVKVTLIDDNDNVPFFPSVADVKIPESLHVGSTVANVPANDVDQYPLLEYSFADQASVWQQFAIEKYTGRVVLVKPCTSIPQRNFTLDVKVHDGKSTAFVAVKVDVEGEDTRVLRFTQLLYDFALPITSEVDSVVGKVTTDWNKRHGSLSYQVVSEHPTRNLFSISSDNGVITLRRSIIGMLPLPNVSELIVEAKIIGEPLRKSRTVVLVKLLTEHSRETISFIDDLSSVEIPEDLAPFNAVTPPLVVDRNGLPRPVKLTVEGTQANTFSVDHQRRLVLTRPLDREKRAEYQLSVTAVCASNSAVKALKSLTVIVTDVNDNPPLFEQRRYETEINEDTPIGSTVLIVKANDVDTGLNAEIRYEITSGDTEDLLQIEPTTGALKVQKKLASRNRSDYRLTVRAYDGGSPSLDDLARVWIRIRSGNSRQRLFFPGFSYIEKVPENSPPGTVLFTARVVQYETKNASIAYSVGGTDDRDMFVVNPETGEVRTGTILDYEQKQFYTFTVYADDGQQQASVACSVIVTGVDEYAPCFNQSFYTFQVSHDVLPGSVIGSIEAQDKDFGDDGQVKYSLKEDNDLFRIDPFAGKIYVNKSLAEFYRSRQISHKGEQQKPDTMTVTLEVMAYSESDAGGVKENSTVVHLQIGHFVATTEGAVQSSGLITSIALIIILLLLIIGVAVLLLRRQQQRRCKPSSLHSISFPKNSSLNEWTSDLRPKGFAGRCQKASNYLSKLTTKPSDMLNCSQPLTAHQQHPSVSGFSNKSSGRGSLEDCENPSKTTLAFDKTEQRHSGTQHRYPDKRDSAISVLADDSSSICSDSAVALEYLNNLGVTIETDSSVDKPREAERSRLPSSHSQMVTESQVADGIDVHELLYAKVSELLADSQDGIRTPANDCSSLYSNLGFQPHLLDRLTGVSSLKPSGSWAPAYQPVTTVLTEICKMKTDHQNSLQRRKQ